MSYSLDINARESFDDNNKKLIAINSDAFWVQKEQLRPSLDSDSSPQPYQIRNKIIVGSGSLPGKKIMTPNNMTA